MNGTHSPMLVLTSLLVAIAASYTALDLAGSVTAAKGRARYAWLAGGAIAMGLGIWSMHFVGMLAFQLPMPIAYHEPQVLLSAGVAIAASLLALLVASRRTLGIGSILAGGALMGPAIAGMHYIGMAAIRVPARLSYDGGLVALSVAIAIGASCIALWLAFRFRREDAGGRWMFGKAISAVVMGIAIAGMHYTAMAAAHFGPVGSAEVGSGSQVVASSALAAEVIIGTMVVLGIALLGGVLDRRMQSQRQTVDRLASVMDVTTDFVSTADAHGRFLHMNRAGRAMLGIGLDEDIGRMTLMDIYPPRLHEQVIQKQVPQAMQEGLWRGETVFQHRDGRETPVSLVGLVHRSSRGEVEFLSAVARDISEQVGVREALELAHAEAERAGAAKTSFLANMSHEIRTPLNGITGMVELLLDTDLTPEQRRHADLINTSAEALLAVVNDVLDLSKIEAGQLELETASFDLHGLVDSAVRLHAVAAAERGVELVYDIRPDVPGRVRGDPGRLRQVLTNLIGNAVKFTHRGEIVVSVAGKTGAEDSSLIRFRVKDTGIGITAEHLGAVFQAFKQADPSTTRKYGGTGLGLSIARRLVNLMGGDIQVTSTPGRGSEFSFAIPLEVEVTDTRGPARAVQQPTLRKARVIVVDDNATNRELVREMLSSFGCNVTEAEGVATGLSELRRAHKQGVPYHLVISDLLMPERDGFDLATSVRGDPELASTKVMLLTSAGGSGDRERARQLGISAYLLKPISRLELLEAALTVLGGPAGSAASKLVTRYSIEETRQVRRILLAEDNPVNQQVAGAMLRKRGHLVDIVENGRQAVDAALRGSYDLVLMDIQMPELDGLSATQEIRKALGDRSLPIVALTANALPAERQRCLAGGMDGYLSKPFKAHELFAAVESWNVKPDHQPPTDSAAEAPPPADLKTFRSELREAGIEEMVLTLLETFLKDAPGRLAAIERAVQAGNGAEITSAAHAYKSAAGTIKAAGLAETLRQAELAGSAGDLEKVRALLEQIQREHIEVVACVELEKLSIGPNATVP